MNGLIWYLLGLLALGIIVNIVAWGDHHKRAKKSART